MAGFTAITRGIQTAPTGGVGGKEPNSILSTSSVPAVAPGVPWAVNVRDGKYGAKGDGATDDTAAILAAQAAAIAAQRYLYFPSGTYKITSALTVSSGERWIGDKWGFGQNTNGPTKLAFTLAAPGACISPATPSAFTDGVILTDLWIFGDNTNTTFGLSLASGRHWSVDRVFISNCTSHPLNIFGQRTATGGTNPGDATYSSFRDCVFESNSATADAAYLGGTLVNTSATITSDSGATVAISDTAQVQGNTGTIVCADNGEWINFTGKSTSSGAGNLTGCTRAINGTTQISHTNGTQFAVRRSMGAANMNAFFNCMFTSQGGSSRYGLNIDAGASNSFHKCSFVSMGSDGVHASWYSNSLVGCVSENNGGWGVRFDNAFDSHDNWVFAMHDGGSNTSGFITDDSGFNSALAYDKGIHLAAGNPASAPAPLPSSLYGASDGLPHWNDSTGTARLIVSSVASSTATLTAGSVTISNASITANSIVKAWSIAGAGTEGALYVTLSAGSGFTIHSTSGTDTSKVYYEIVSY